MAGRDEKGRFVSGGGSSGGGAPAGGGGAKSDTRVWEKIKAEIDKASDAHVKVGVLQSKGGSAQRDGITMVELAAIHEFGAPRAGIPERSFIRSTFAVHAAAELKEVVTKLAKGLANGKTTADRALSILGVWATAAVKKSISNRLIKQDLRPDTIRRKNRTAKDKTDATTALVDTGRLINAIQYEKVLK